MRTGFVMNVWRKMKPKINKFGKGDVFLSRGKGSCDHSKFKKRITHGKKSSGYYVCKICKKVIQKPKRGGRR